jgi:hypothetical protein
MRAISQKFDLADEGNQIEVAKKLNCPLLIPENFLRFRAIEAFDGDWVRRASI